MRDRLACAALAAAIGAGLVIGRPASARAQSADTPPPASVAADAATNAAVPAAAEYRPAQLIVDTNPKAHVATYGLANGTPGIPIPLPPGEHRVRISRPGYTSRTEHVRLEAGEMRTLFAPIEAKTQRGAITRAVLFPGWGAYYMEKRTEAQALLLLTGVAVGGAIYFDHEMQDHIDVYEDALAIYESAISSADAEQAWRAVEEAHGDIENDETIRNIFIVSAVSFHALGIAQAIFEFPWHDSEAQVSLSPRLDGLSREGVRVSLVSLAAR